MGRKPCCTKEGVNRGAWSDQEDKILITYIKNHGEGKWRELPERAGLSRCGKSCRLRWLNYLRPDIKRGNISPEEEDLIIRLHKLLGNRWSLIAGRLPGRTDNEIKNYWNTCLSKKMKEAQTSKPPIQEQNSRSQEKRSSLETSVEEEPSSELETHQVIRTKATRCTKVSLPPQEDDQMNEKDIVPGPEDDDSMNFLLDCDMGQIVVSNAPDSDHVRAFREETREKNGFTSEDDGGHIFSSWFDDRYSFGEAAFDEWRKSDYIQNDMAFELEMWDLP